MITHARKQLIAASDNWASWLEEAYSYGVRFNYPITAPYKNDKEKQRSMNDNEEKNLWRPSLLIYHSNVSTLFTLIERHLSGSVSWCNIKSMIGRNRVIGVTSLALSWDQVLPGHPLSSASVSRTGVIIVFRYCVRAIISGYRHACDSPYLSTWLLHRDASVSRDGSRWIYGDVIAPNPNPPAEEAVCPSQ